MCDAVHTTVAKHAIAVHFFPAAASQRSLNLDGSEWTIDVTRYPPFISRLTPFAFASHSDRRAKENSYAMISILHPVVVIGTIVFSLSILLFLAYLITLLPQKTDAVEAKTLNFRINVNSVFEQAAITCTITALYAALMTLFFTLIN